MEEWTDGGKMLIHKSKGKACGCLLYFKKNYLKFVNIPYKKANKSTLLFEMLDRKKERAPSFLLH